MKNLTVLASHFEKVTATWLNDDERRLKKLNDEVSAIKDLCNLILDKYKSASDVSSLTADDNFQLSITHLLKAKKSLEQVSDKIIFDDIEEVYNTL